MHVRDNWVHRGGGSGGDIGEEGVMPLAAVDDDDGAAKDRGKKCGRLLAGYIRTCAGYRVSNFLLIQVSTNYLFGKATS